MGERGEPRCGARVGGRGIGWRRGGATGRAMLVHCLLRGKTAAGARGVGAWTRGAGGGVGVRSRVRREALSRGGARRRGRGRAGRGPGDGGGVPGREALAWGNARGKHEGARVAGGVEGSSWGMARKRPATPRRLPDRAAGNKGARGKAEVSAGRRARRKAGRAGLLRRGAFSRRQARAECPGKERARIRRGVSGGGASPNACVSFPRRRAKKGPQTARQRFVLFVAGPPGRESFAAFARGYFLNAPRPSFSRFLAFSSTLFA